MRRPKFRVRTLIVAVAVVGVILAAERWAVRGAICFVSDNGDGEFFFPAEAIAAWALMHAPIVLASLIARLIRPGLPPWRPVEPNPWPSTRADEAAP